jgi:hypothetical protein
MEKRLQGILVIGPCRRASWLKAGRRSRYPLNRNPMPEEQKVNPFKIGDRVTFTPDDHTVGWSWSSFDRLRLHPGATGTVTRIGKENYLYLDDDRGGFTGSASKRQLDSSQRNRVCNYEGSRKPIQNRRPRSVRSRRANNRLDIFECQDRSE